MRQIFSKKSSLFTLVLTLCFILVLAGCGNGNNSGNGTSGEVSGNTSTNDSASVSGKLTVWGWDKVWFEGTAAKFNKKYPNVTLSFVEVSAGDYLKKIQTSIASGSELPDIIWGEAAFRGALYELNVLQSLSEEPYKFDTSNLLDFELPLLTNSKGELVGLEQSGSPGALAYKRDLAKQYFGTDDPDELSAMFTDWDTFIAKGKEVYEKSGGKSFMLGSLMDAYTIFSNQGTTAIVDGNKVNTAEVLWIFTQLQSVRDNNTEGKLAMWSPTWNASYSQDNVIFYPAANWSPEFVIKPNDKSSTGRWGLMVPPEGGFPYGGTTIGIWKESKNKDAAWTYLNWLLGTDEGAEANFATSDYILPLKSFFKDTSKLSSGADEFFGGQDLGKFWVEKVFPNMKSKAVTKYDQDIYSSSELVLQVMAQDNSFDAKQALEKWEEQLKKNHPELVFE
ncbi:ABC transporter substrate-binding protein [Paenibacillus typhae]|uniref:Carbohydrate ABC transporter substrate-binding protein, CUT1 family n=1 Tax=Paenibacillus typhae TaxID=1174501 RepID=A0A1G8YSM8_9BACL|nr:extracellular solute-binding protein [Paenibacillus typhae]SDK05030.1 carbohydrate ABC transporter substrate-binding protein, CUT1 family [Paenibacillus typhae]